MSVHFAMSSSDQDLMLRASDGDRQALVDLVARHEGGTASREELRVAEELVEALVRDDSALPFRAAWAARHQDTATHPSDPIWAAYVGLPSAWKVALWHYEVEGHSVGRIAHHLGMSDNEALRAILSARSALKRLLALSPQAAGRHSACEDVVAAFRFMPPAVLDRAGTRALREHGRHCDECLPLIRRLLIADRMLREHLAHAVLDSLADSYLADKPRARRLPKRIPLEVSTRTIPVRKIGLVGLAAAAVVGAFAIAPQLVDRPGPPSLAADARPAAPPRAVAGVALARVSSTIPASPRLGEDRFLSDTARLESGADGAAGSGPGSAGTGQVESPDAGSGDPGQETPVTETPVTETPVDEQPEVPTEESQPVDITVEEGGVTVVVAPGDPLPEVEISIQDPAGTLSSTLTGALGQ